MWANRHLRGQLDYELSTEEKDFIGALKQATDTNTVNDKVLYRSVDARAVFGDMTDMEYDSLRSSLLYPENQNRYTLEAKEKFLKDIKGKAITEKGFMSTTKSKDVALEWGDFSGSDKPIVLELEVPKKTKGIDLKKWDISGDEQYEVLLSPNTKYEIKSVSGDNGTIYVKAKIKESLPKENDSIKRIAYDKAIELGYNPLSDDKVVEVLREDSNEWIKSLTEDEKKAITKYTYNGVDKDGKRLFEKINGYLEGRYTPSEDKELNLILNNAYNINHGILKNKLQDDIIVYRNDKYSNSLEGTVKKFLSTSVTKNGVINGKPNVAIIVPKGTNGAYVENLSELKKQREFLFNRDLYLKKILRDDGFIIFEAVIK